MALGVLHSAPNTAAAIRSRWFSLLWRLSNAALLVCGGGQGPGGRL